MAFLIAARSSGSAARMRYASSSIADHPPPSQIQHPLDTLGRRAQAYRLCRRPARSSANTRRGIARSTATRAAHAEHTATSGTAGAPPVRREPRRLERVPPFEERQATDVLRCQRGTHTPPLASLAPRARRSRSAAGRRASGRSVLGHLLSSHQWWCEPAGPCRGHAICSCPGRGGPSVRRTRGWCTCHPWAAKATLRPISSLGPRAPLGAPHPQCPEQRQRPERERRSPRIVERPAETDGCAPSSMRAAPGLEVAPRPRPPRVASADAAALRGLARSRLPRAASSDRLPVAHSTGLPGEAIVWAPAITATLRGQALSVSET